MPDRAQEAHDVLSSTLWDRRRAEAMPEGKRRAAALERTADELDYAVVRALHSLRMRRTDEIRARVRAPGYSAFDPTEEE